MFDQLLLTLFLLIPMDLMARAVVAGTRHLPILIIVVFGLSMGLVLGLSDTTTTGPCRSSHW